MLTLPRHWFLVFLALLFLFVAGFYFLRYKARDARQTLTRSTPLPSPSAPSPKQTPIDSIRGIEPPTESPSETPRAAVIPTPPPTFVGQLKLIVPVVGISPDQLQDTFTDARSDGRTHDAIDIPAPAGAAVIAATDGEIVRLFYSERGGTTIYQLTTDRKLILYYAHLQGYADGLMEGKIVHQGEVLAYVGDSGNATPGNYHLHFSMAVVADPKRYWEGTNINPFPLLRNPQ